jgi:hypothetical protein
VGGATLPQVAAHRMERRKRKRACRDGVDRTSEVAILQRAIAFPTACSATSVDMSSPVLGVRPWLAMSHFENERGYLPAVGSRFEAGPMLVGSHPGSASKHIPGGCTAHTRTVVVVENRAPDPVLALRTPCLYRYIPRLFRGLSFC